MAFFSSFIDKNRSQHIEFILTKTWWIIYAASSLLFFPTESFKSLRKRNISMMMSVSSFRRYLTVNRLCGVHMHTERKWRERKIKASKEILELVRVHIRFGDIDLFAWIWLTCVIDFSNNFKNLNCRPYELWVIWHWNQHVAHTYTFLWRESDKIDN